MSVRVKSTRSTVKRDAKHSDSCELSIYANREKKKRSDGDSATVFATVAELIRRSQTHRSPGERMDADVRKVAQYGSTTGR